MSNSNLTQTFTSPQKWYTLEYPRMWEMEVVENIPAFFDPLFGKGAVQLFSVKLGDQVTITEKIKEYPFLEGKNLIEKMSMFLDLQSVSYEKENLVIIEQSADTNLIAYEYYKENTFYIGCMLQKGNTFILAMYNCVEAPAEEEAKVIGEILKSITILS